MRVKERRRTGLHTYFQQRHVLAAHERFDEEGTRVRLALDCSNGLAVYLSILDVQHTDLAQTGRSAHDTQRPRPGPCSGMGLSKWMEQYQNNPGAEDDRLDGGSAKKRHPIGKSGREETAKKKGDGAEWSKQNSQRR